MIHDLKIWTCFFDDVASGRKTCELRRDDRGFAIDDLLRLREFDPEGMGYYTGREVTVQVTHITRPSGVPEMNLLPAGHVALSIRVLPYTDAAHKVWCVSCGSETVWSVQKDGAKFYECHDCGMGGQLASNGRVVATWKVMRSTPPTDWVVLDASTQPPVYRCRRCGVTEALALPVGVKAVAARCAAFLEFHRCCKVVKS